LSYSLFSWAFRTFYNKNYSLTNYFKDEYIIYENNLLIFSFPFLAYNIYRYYNISIFKKLGEFPIDVVIKDKILLLNTFLISIIIILVYVFY